MSVGHERTPQEIADLRAENRGQNRRLERLEERVTELRVALVGIDDQNGLRGELRDHKEYTRRTLSEIEHKLDTIIPSVKKSLLASLGLISTVVGIIYTVTKILD